MNESNKIYVGNLPYSVTEEELTEHFQQYGSIAELNLIKDPATGNSKGFAFISFDSQDVAQSAINGSKEAELGGRKLNVNMARSKPRDRGGRGGRSGGGFRGDRRF